MIHLPRISALLALLSLSLSGCASYETFAVGQALTIEPHTGAREDPEKALAVVLEAAQGTGVSEEKPAAGKSIFMEWRGRALLNAQRQQVGGFVGASELVWIGERAPIWIGLNTGIGVEHTRDTIFIEPLFRLNLGTGFVLSEEIERSEMFVNPWGIEGQPGGLERRMDRQMNRFEADRIYQPPVITRKRSLLTLNLTGDVDTRFTRDPLYVVGVLIGVTASRGRRSVSGSLCRSNQSVGPHVPGGGSGFGRV